MNVAVDTLTDEVEPYLLRRHFIVRTPAGAATTAAAYRHLGLAEPPSEPEISLFDQHGCLNNGSRDRLSRCARLMYRRGTGCIVRPSKIGPREVLNEPGPGSRRLRPPETSLRAGAVPEGKKGNGTNQGSQSRQEDDPRVRARTVDPPPDDPVRGRGGQPGDAAQGAGHLALVPRGELLREASNRSGRVRASRRRSGGGVASSGGPAGRMATTAPRAVSRPQAPKGHHAGRWTDQPREARNLAAKPAVRQPTSVAM